MPVATGSTGTRRKRGEGQWALGYHEPLNKDEENKRNDDGLNVRQRIIDVYSKNGFDSIDPADLRGRFRWYGLYTQRRPGIDGGKTAVLELEELDDRYFMLRVRLDGCPLAGIDTAEIIDATPEIAAIGERYIGDSAFSNLPRKFKSYISGCVAQCAIHEINDIAFVGVVDDSGETGYD